MKVIEQVARICPMCGTLEIKEIELDKDAYKHFCKYNSKLIQDYFPDLTLNEREFLKTGYCDDCQEILFAPPEDEDKVLKLIKRNASYK